MKMRFARVVIGLGLCWSVAPIAQAQFAVIDVAAINQLIAEVRLLEDQLTTARAHLAQAQLEYESITGARGMERLLSGVNRNYLPTSWAQLQAAMQAAGGLYGVLANEVAAAVAANAVLMPADLASMPPGVRQQMITGRRLTALQQSLTHEALATASTRFQSLQQLIDAIPTATDQKGVLELQARVDAESNMMQNEQSKLLTLTALVQAEERANVQQLHESAVAGYGHFATRFQPQP